MNKISLKTIIENRLGHLQERKMMIPRYIARPEKFLGNKDFSMDMIPQIERDIEECQAALRGIDEWRKSKIKHINH